MDGSEELTYRKTAEMINLQTSTLNNESSTQIQDPFNANANKNCDSLNIQLYTDLLNQGLSYNEIIDLLNSLNKKIPPKNDIKTTQINAFNHFNEIKSHRIIDKQIQAEKKKNSVKKSNIQIIERKKM